MRAAPRVKPGGRGLWRGLGLFWLLVVLAAGGTAATLAWMGAPVETAPRVLIPPEGAAFEPAIPAPAAAAIVPPAAPAETAAAPPAAESVPPTAAPPLAPPPAPLVAPSPLALTLPDAPEPPPLPIAEAAAAGHVIPDPEPALLEDGAAGLLPRIAADGRQPRQAYARPFDRADTRPRIGLVIRDAPEAALRRLPPTVALAYATAPAPLLAEARARGMETLVLLPANPNSSRLDAALARFAGYVGALGLPPDGRASAAVQDALRTRGLLYLDPGPTTAATHAWGRTADLLLEEAPTRGEVNRQLAALEQRARDTGSALAILPEASSALWLDRLAAWAATLPERGFVLAPVTAMIRRPASAQR
jgi:polysaccharide deacetylase 2 family uncharacterized protein YibQ